MSDFDRTAEYANKHSEEVGQKSRKTIWLVFWILLAVTTVEVTLGLVWRQLGIAFEFVKWTFILLTIVKAYYIVAHYMHLKHEYKSFIYIITIPFVVLTIYFIILLLNEGIYLNTDADKLLNLM